MDLLLHLFTAIFHAIGTIVHILLTPPFFDSLLSVLFFIVGRLTGGLGLFLRVALLLVKMAAHFYNTHPDAKRQKRSTKIDNEFDKLYKEHVLPRESSLREARETGARG